ncbi:cache domain-containing sensor histidine kinase [Desmospora activa]|uniref:histidine kinase n=1 Tax=Desmospora activa DSM 45169 TaxID=1121389 RepID=A0A2T4ZC22_9BACL|nr:histidine kinase [Desmospora activa]PTM59416.1 two-component system sensor histidine kinase YesM [Desmospora activa DSM 45169]
MWKRLRKMRLPRSFRLNLMFAAVTCILIPACLSLMIYNSLTKNAIKEQAVTNSQESLQLVNGYVSHLFNYMLDIANYVQMDAEMNAILKESASDPIVNGPDGEYERFMDRSKVTDKIDHLTLGGEKCYVTILLKNGTFYTNYPVYDYHPTDLMAEPWFDRLNRLYGFESHWIGSTPTVFRSEQRNNPYQISLARTLREGDAGIYGYVIVTILENQVNQIFANAPLDQETMLVDSGGRILSHPNGAQIGKYFPYLHQISEGNRSRIIPIDGENYLVSGHALPYSGWTLVALTPYKKAVFKINTIFNRVFLFQLGSFFTFLLLLLYILQRFTKPLVRLGKVANTVQRGELGVRSHIRGPDEIGQLGLSFDLMLDKVKAMIDEITVTEMRKRKAELLMLQAQINPHFLFNVLNSIRMKMMGKGDRESAEMISSLSKLLRMTISRDKGSIGFHEEVETIRDYVRLMNMRQKEKVALDIDVTTDAAMMPVPRFFLQPLIENALIHAFYQSAGMIVLRAWVRNRQLVVMVEDNGEGMNQADLQALRQKIACGRERPDGEVDSRKGFSGIGLANVYERLHMTYGDSFQMEMDSEQGKGTRITLLIPMEEAHSIV